MNKYIYSIYVENSTVLLAVGKPVVKSEIFIHFMETLIYLLSPAGNLISW